MSLKAFHVFFITVSSLLAAGVGAWSLHRHSVVENPHTPYLMLAIGSFVACVVLVTYGVWFLKKTKGMSLV